MVVVIGAGGAGLYFSKLYKEKNPHEKVTLIEEHKEIGKPVQCTGILTKEILKLIPEKDLKKFTINNITRAEIHSPNNYFLTNISNDYIIDNVAFIDYLAQKTQKAEVEIKTSTRYIKNERNIVTLRNIKTKKIQEIKMNNLVGADGPSSNVAKNNNLYGKREFLTGVQARVRIKDLDKETIKFYPYIGEYAWFAPEGDEIARIGVAANSNAKKIFDDFIKKFPGKILEMQGGPIPLHKPRISAQHAANQPTANSEQNTKNPARNSDRRTQNAVNSSQTTGFVSLIGDSALQIKNTTGGGIIPGLKAAKALSEGLKEYNHNLKPLNRELYIHYLMNKALHNYSDNDWDRLIKKANNPKIKRILSNTNRDEAKKMVLKLIINPKMTLEGFRAGIKLISPHK